jgi:predicted class III extradiol MEMO1 family dioxygenase
MSKSPRIHEDTLAHLREHSLEVQLPFIQYFKPDFKIVPIQMLDVRLETCLEVGRAVGEAVRERGQEPGARSQEADQEKIRTDNSGPRIPTPDPRGNVLIIASSDMTHYESAAAAKEKDFKAIHHILDLDPEGLYRTIKDIGITMCGFGPAVAMLVASKILGARKAELVKYTNSGDVSGDYEQVVGYAGIIIM